MYYYPSLGKSGRLGNQMFQYAATFALAKTHNTAVGLPTPYKIFHKDHEIQLYDAFPNISAIQIELSEMSSAKYDYIAKEGIDFNFDPSLFTARDDCRVHGYFQSEKYFESYRKEIKEEFRFSDNVVRDCQLKLKQLKQEHSDSPLCAVHFRRGDYTKLSHVHTNLGAEYYNPAFGWMSKNIQGCKFVAFSDDIKWCKDNLPKDFILSEMPSMLHDMKLMSMCDAHIIANSSFSWWAAWLSDSTKQVIAPQSWFGPEGPKSWNTIYASGWGII